MILKIVGRTETGLFMISLPKYPVLFAFVAILSVSLAAAADIVHHEGADYWIYQFDPKDEKLELFLGTGKGNPNTFPSLEARLNKQGRQLKFAVNAGIFEPNFISSGLHVADGKTINNLNLKDFKKSREGEFTPNFYLKPNGVFYLLEDGSAGIVESSRFQSLKLKSSVRLANQSGPLLLAGKKIHPIFTKDSESTRHRNGVGVTADGKIVFACTVRDRKKGLSNLYNFSTLFLEKLNCPDALYLDGDISYVFIREKTPPLQETNWFGGIFTITTPKS